MSADEKSCEREDSHHNSSSGHSTSPPPTLRPESIKSTELSRTTSRIDRPGFIYQFLRKVRTKETNADPGPPPDGGPRAWSHAVLVHMIIFVTWGNINSFGVFQAYYTETLNQPASAISWIGGIQTFITFILGTFSGRALDAGFYKPVFCIGTFIQVLGIFMTSISKTYWQVFLAQGVCQGIGNGLIFVPSMALLATYFVKRRGIAYGIAASGSATGGMVFPAMVANLLPKVGFGWTVRVIGLLVLVFLVIAAIALTPRLPPRKSGPIVEWSAFKERPYLLFAFAAYFLFW